MKIDEINKDFENAKASMHSLLANALSFNPFFSQLEKYHRAKSKPLTEQKWYSKNAIIGRCRHNKIAIRVFRCNLEPGVSPIVFVPPEAGSDSQIVDYCANQSLIECAIKNSKADIYVLDKLPATEEHTNYSIEDSIQSMNDCIDKLPTFRKEKKKRTIHLVGLCQGGWQSAMYAARFPEKVESLTLAAAPIDFSAGESAMKTLIDNTPLEVYQEMVNQGGGNMPGYYIHLGFKNLLAYERYIGDEIKLYQNIDDEKYLKRHETFRQWYDQTQPLPGKMFMEIVEKLFKKNQFYKDGIDLLGEKISAKDIKCKVYSVVGDKDHITTKDQLFNLNATKKTVVKAGHIGVFMGKDVIKTFWSKHFRSI